MTDDHEAALIAAVRADPYDLQARQVYADWLEERGDLRGEYLRLDSQVQTLPARLAELVEHIDPAWLNEVHGRFRITIVAVARDQKIGAIKLVRELTRLGLKDAKDLVEAVTATNPVVMLEDVELDRAREIVETCAEAMSLRVEPSASGAVSPSGPSGLPGASGPSRYHRPYRVLLVAVIDRLAAIQQVHQRYGRTIADARDIVDAITPAQPFELAVRLDATAAAELAVTYGALGMIKIEHAT